MNSSNQMSLGEADSESETSSVDIQRSPHTIVNKTIGINVEGGSTFIADDVTVNITGPSLTKDDYWHQFTAGDEQTKREALFRLLDLSYEDKALADKLSRFFLAPDTQMQHSNLCLLRDYKWSRRPPQALMHSLEKLSDHYESVICYTASELLDKYNRLPE